MTAPLSRQKLVRHDDPDQAKAAWMAQGGFGLMVHYLGGLTWSKGGTRLSGIDDLAAQFDVDGFVADFEATGADWLIFPVGQNSGFYLSPNSLLDRWAGAGHCSRRDLVGEIAAALRRRGKRFICYATCEVRGNPTVHQAFEWNTAPGTDQRAFQNRYTAFLAEWSERWGELLDGWWVDGCYTWPAFHHENLDWPRWYRALRAGNPQAVLAFNDGSFCCGYEKPVRAEHDFTAGEVELLRDGQIVFGREKDAPLYLPQAQFVGPARTQWHALVPIDCFWVHGGFTPQVAAEFGRLGERFKVVPAENPGAMESPVYGDEELKEFVARCRSVGGAVTLNVGIYQEGRLGPETMKQLARLA